MTAEEIEIIVTAKVTEVLKEFKKILPQVKQEMAKVQQEIEKVDLKGLSRQIKATGVDKELGKVKQKIKDVFDPSDTSGMTMQHWIGLRQQISGVSKEVQKLKGSSAMLGNAIELEKYKQKMQQLEVQAEKTSNATSKVGYKKYSSNSIQNFVDNYGNKANVQNNNISVQPTQQSLSLWDKLRGKIKQIKPQIQQTKNSMSGISSQVQKISSIAVKVKNPIKGWGGNVKLGIGQVMKYAGALFSLRGIYNILSSSASSWLGSQNAEAQQLNANIDYMKYALGSTLAPIIQGIVNLIYQALKGVQSLIYVMTGINIFAKASASSYSSMASSASKAKNEMEQLAGIHSDINNIQDSDSSGSGTGASTPSFDLSNVDTTGSLLDKIKNGDWYSVGKAVGEKLNEALEKIPWDKIQATSKKIAFNLASGINGFIDGTDWKLVGSTIGDGINTGLTFVHTFLSTTNFKNIGKSVATTLNSWVHTQDWKLTGQTIADSINTAIDFCKGLVDTLEWDKLGTKIGTAIGTAIEDIKWEDAGDSLLNAMKELVTALKNAFFTAAKDTAIENYMNAILSFLGIELTDEQMQEYKTRFEDAYDRFFIQGDWSVLTESMKTLGLNIIKGLLEGIVKSPEEIKKWIEEHIFNPFVEKIKELFGIHSPSTVMFEIGQNIIQGLLNGIASLVGIVTGKWEEIKNKAIQAFEKIRNTVSEKWENIKTATAEKWNNIKEKVSTTVENVRSKVQEKFGQARDKVIETWDNVKTATTTKWEEMKGKVFSESENIRNTVSSKFGDAREKLSTAFEGMKNKLKSAFGTMESDSETSGNNIFSKIKDSIGNLGEKAKTWGSDMVQGFTNGINQAKSKVESAAKSVAEKVKSFLHFSRPDVGPLREYEKWMPDMIQGLTRTLNEKAPILYNATQLLAEKMAENLNMPVLSDISIPALSYSPSSLNLASITPNIQTNNLITQTLLRDNQSNNDGRPISVQVYLGNKAFVDEVIDGINDKTVKTGKDTIIRIDR